MKHLITTEVRMEKPVLNEKETSLYTGMSCSWLRQARCYRWSHAPKHMKVGKAVRYARADLDKWIAERREATG